MKLIIAGGRDYRLTATDRAALGTIPDVAEVVSGGQRGADTDGEAWGADQGHKVTVFEADWDRYGYAAGPIRNRKMAEYADAVALFPGNRGTADMFKAAVKAGLKVYDYRY